MSTTTIEPISSKVQRAAARAAALQMVAREVRYGMEYRVPSASNAAQEYRVVRTSDGRGTNGWSCPCKGWKFTGACHHLGAVKRRAEREGWPFESDAIDTWASTNLPEGF